MMLNDDMKMSKVFDGKVDTVKKLDRFKTNKGAKKVMSNLNLNKDMSKFKVGKFNGMKRINQQKGLSMFGDFDGDKLPNILDCNPRNRLKQGPRHNLEGRLKGLEEKTRYEQERQLMQENGNGQEENIQPQQAVQPMQPANNNNVFKKTGRTIASGAQKAGAAIGGLAKKGFEKAGEGIREMESERKEMRELEKEERKEALRRKIRGVGSGGSGPKGKFRRVSGGVSASASDVKGSSYTTAQGQFARGAIGAFKAIQPKGLVNVQALGGVKSDAFALSQKMKTGGQLPPEQKISLFTGNGRSAYDIVQQRKQMQSDMTGQQQVRPQQMSSYGQSVQPQRPVQPQQMQTQQTQEQPQQEDTNIIVVEGVKYKKLPDGRYKNLKYGNIVSYPRGSYEHGKDDNMNVSEGQVPEQQEAVYYR